MKDYGGEESARQSRGGKRASKTRPPITYFLQVSGRVRCQGLTSDYIYAVWYFINHHDQAVCTTGFEPIDYATYTTTIIELSQLRREV